MKQVICLTMIAVSVLAACGKTEDKAAPGKEAATKAPEAVVQKAPPAKLTPDVLAGDKLAKEICASCHGVDGVRSEPGVPFIAGLNEDYMVASLHGYKDGSRHIVILKAAADKQKAMAQLSPQQIADVSAYYASLSSPWKGAGIGIHHKKSPVVLSKENIAAGIEIAGRCNSCHGEDGNSVGHSSAASLAAMPPDYFVYSLKTYFDDRRKHKIMKVFGMGDSLSEKDIENLAAYYAVQTPKKPPVSKLGDAKRGAAFANDCVGCHGPDGNSLNSSLPNLTGQPVEYLILSMRDYRDGKRKDPAMRYALKGMSDANIADIAAYFATLEPVSLHHWKAQSSKAFKPEEEGKRIARMCDSCHGKDGNSTKPNVPNLTGLTPRYLTEATIAYRDGLWKHDVMREMVSFLQDDDIEKVALYYALQEPVATKTPGEFDMAIGEKIKPACTLCHSDEGIKKDPRIPNLNGQDHKYLIEATLDYANGKRKNEDMEKIAKAIKPQDMSNLVNVAGYYTLQKANKPPVIMPQPAMKTIEKCHSCHGAKGESSTATLPRLAGQSEAYLISAMKAYQDKQRKGHEIAEHGGMSLIEMKGIAAYYAKQ